MNCQRVISQMIVQIIFSIFTMIESTSYIVSVPDDRENQQIPQNEILLF